MKRIVAVVLILVSVALSGCASERQDKILQGSGLAQAQLADVLRQSGHEIYGAAAGVGDTTAGGIRIEISLQRESAGLWALCLGADGTAQISVGGDERFVLECQQDGAAQTLTDDLDVQGNKLLITIKDAPAAASWAVASASES